MRNIFKSQIEFASKAGDPKAALTTLSRFIADNQRSIQDALLECLHDVERRAALELFKQETKDALKEIDKLQGWS